MKARNSLAIAMSIICVFGTIALSQTPCPVGADERVWVGNAIAAWTKVRKDSLGLPSAKLPWLLLFNETCVIHIEPDPKSLPHDPLLVRPKRSRFGRITVRAWIAPHSGKITLPDGGEVPLGLLSFAAPYDNGKASFLISALPAVWRKAPHLQSEPNVDVLAASVFVHEMTHTLHSGFYDQLSEIGFPRVDSSLGQRLVQLDQVDVAERQMAPCQATNRFGRELRGSFACRQKCRQREERTPSVRRAGRFRRVRASGLRHDVQGSVRGLERRA